jgi:hypothetical protein
VTRGWTASNPPNLAVGTRGSILKAIPITRDATQRVPARREGWSRRWRLLDGPDLIKFGDALRTGKLVRPETFAEMTKPRSEGHG